MLTDMMLKQFKMCNFVIKKNLSDMTHEESLVQPVPAGNCANWVLGHMLVYRCRLLRGLGEDAFWSETDYKLYERHEEPLTRTEDAKSVTELWAGLDATLASLEQAFAKLTAAKLSEIAPFIQEDEPGGTFETAVTVFAFHDAYHAGQTGLLRRVIGRAPADM